MGLRSASLGLALFCGLATAPAAASSPADPSGPPLRYESVTAGTKSYRPVEPMPWGDVNRRVAPPVQGRAPAPPVEARPPTKQEPEPRHKQ